MRRSQYTLAIPNWPSSGDHLLFNSLTLALAVADHELKALLDDLKPGSPLPAHAESALAELAKQGFIVPDEVDENLLVDHLFRRLKYDTPFLQAVVLTTYACNFGCTYCLEEGVKRPVHMTERTCRDTAQWIIRKLEEKRPQELRLDFYGGEPLLNLPAMQRISKALWEHTQGLGIPMHVTITTNGALLTEAVVDDLLGYGLAGVKLTLDGDREAHDHKRPFKNGRGSYDLIVENMLRVVDKVNVSVGGNFDAENKESMPRLLDHLVRLGLQEKLTMVSFKPIGASMGNRDVGCLAFSDGSLAEDMLLLRNEAAKRGFRVLQGMQLHSCTLTNGNGVVIDPTGKLFGCPAFVGYDDFVVGDIYQDTEDYRAIELMSLEPWKECYGCPYVPLCGGGCRYAAYVKHGDIRGTACEKHYFDTMTPCMLKDWYGTLGTGLGASTEPSRSSSGTG